MAWSSICYRRCAVKKYTLDVDQDIADKIFLNVLKHDYLMLCREIARIKINHGRDVINYPDYIREDYEASYDYVIAMEQLFKYYMMKEDADSLTQEGTDTRYGKSA